MKPIITIVLFFAVLLVNCTDSKTRSTSVSEKKWYEGGNLHKAKIHEWKNANEQNKLATCGDFMAVIDNSVTMEILLERSVALRSCINEATYGIDNVDNEDVADIAALCIATLGYK